MSSLIWWGHYEPQQTFPDSPWRLSHFPCFPMIPNTHSKQHESLTGNRRKIHPMNDTYVKVVRWNTKILFIHDTKKRGFLIILFSALIFKYYFSYINFFPLHYISFFPLQPWHVIQTSKVFSINRWCFWLHNCLFKMQGKLSGATTLHNL